MRQATPARPVLAMPVLAMLVLAMLVLVAVGTAGCGTAAAAPSPGASGAARPSPDYAAAVASAVSEEAYAAGKAASPAATPRIRYPARGGGRWRTAPAQDTPVAGRHGPLLSYRVLVEQDIRGLDGTAFADTVTATLADPRGWTAGGRWRLRRVGPGDRYDFTIYLATPATRDALCGDRPDGYTSCRNGDKVVLNVARWAKGVPHYGASLSVYRQYMVNHEVGHRLGQGHQRCPGPGRPAPVMQQQTLGLHGCVANSWPYADGVMYAGASGEYGDEPPPPDEGQ